MLYSKLRDDDGVKSGLIALGWDSILDTSEWLRRNVIPAELSPEKKLFLALLEDGIDSALRALRPTKMSNDGSAKRKFERAEARAWIASRSADWLFSFVNVCEILGLNPDAARKKIESQYGENRWNRAFTGLSARAGDGALKISDGKLLKSTKTEWNGGLE